MCLRMLDQSWADSGGSGARIDHQRPQQSGSSATCSNATAAASGGRAVILTRSMYGSRSGLRPACLPGGGRGTGYARGRAATAVLSEVRHERIYRAEVGGIDELPPFAALGKESCALQVLKMECQRRRKEADALGDSARVEPFGAPADEQTENREAMLVGKCSERANDSVRFHDYTIV